MAHKITMTWLILSLSIHINIVVFSQNNPYHIISSRRLQIGHATTFPTSTPTPEPTPRPILIPSPTPHPTPNPTAHRMLVIDPTAYPTPEPTRRPAYPTPNPTPTPTPYVPNPTMYPTPEPTPADDDSIELNILEANERDDGENDYGSNSFIGLLIIFGICLVISSTCIYCLTKHAKKKEFQTVPSEEIEDVM
eukprot:UN02589